MTKAVFIRLIESLDKPGDLLASIRRAAARNDNTHVVDPGSFRVVRGSPFAYWVPARVMVVAGRNGEVRGVATSGLQTSDDFRFLRVAPEPDVSHRRDGHWRTLAKGGQHSLFYSDMALVVAWGSTQRELEAFGESLGNAALTRRSSVYYGRPGLTWPARTQGFNVRALPSGGIFAGKGPSLFLPTDGLSELLARLAIMNSRAYASLLELRLSAGEATARSYETGLIQRTPVPDLRPADEEALASLARRAWSLKRSLDTRTETSHAFVLPVLLQVDGATLAARALAWAERVRTTEAELDAIQAEIDDRCFALYGIQDEDRRAITEGFGGGAGAEEASDDVAEDADEADDEADGAADTVTLAAELVSWAVGVAFGRFDVRLATGERSLPGEPEPFDPLPVCSPGMLTGDDGLPLAQTPAGYPIAFPTDGVLVDDPGHDRDLVERVRRVFEVVFDASADAVWQEAASLLDPKGGDLRSWLRSGFFEHHLKRHSKSRRKAPIVWQLGVPSGGYSVWVYAHRTGRDGLLAIANDLVGPRVGIEERRLSSLHAQAGANPSSRDRAAIAQSEALLDELRTLETELRRVAPLWDPDLDDGIVLVTAPLWRLQPGHRAWQKEIRTKWDELVAGRYDWAHLAMRLWPERVVPKCRSDRSLAIAHGLEEVFWVEGPDGRWTKRPQPTRPVEAVVAERTNPAVKAALADLLAAPAPAGGGRGRRKAA